MEWKHILNEQPEDGSMIVQVRQSHDIPGNKSYYIGLVKYECKGTFQDILNACEENDIPIPNYWWVNVKDFPFPEKYNPIGIVSESSVIQNL